MKKYLVIMGNLSDPSEATKDWKGCFETFDEALASIKNYTIDTNYYRYRYVLEKSTITYDYYTIVNLDDWMK